MMKKKTNWILWGITILIVSFFTLPRLIQHGCFMDGELYTAIAHNMAYGIGSFWYPSFNLIIHNYFDQQPPLTFSIQALWFKFFGSSMYVERLYDYVFCLIHVFLIHLIWKELFKENEMKKMSWLPVILWISIPVCSWDFVNNMEEITMGIFVQLAILFSIKIITHNNFKFHYPILTGISLILAWLCKGFPGLFPLTIFFWAFVFFKEFKFNNAVKNYSMLLATIILALAFLYFNPTSHNSLGLYLNNRVLNSIKNVVETDNRFYIVGRLISELLISIIICVVVLGIKKYKKQPLEIDYKLSLFFMVVGLCGVLPIMITLEQRGFYMTTALPCFAIGFSILIAKPIHDWILLIENKLIKYLQIIFLIGMLALPSVLFYSQNKFIRDENSLSDIYQFGKIVPQHSVVGLSPDLFKDWGTGCYLQRFYFIAVDGYTEYWNTHPYVIINKASASNYQTSLVDYKKLDLQTKAFDLYQHK